MKSYNAHSVTFYSLQIYRMAGPLGFFKGMEARVLYSMPATAICWTTYEFFKYMLSARSYDEYRSSVSGGSATNSDSSRNSSSSSSVRHSTVEKSNKSDETTKANITSGYVIGNIIREEKKPILALQASSIDPANSSVAGTTSTILPPPQLPVISGTGVYNALGFTVHTDGMYDRKSGRGCKT